MSYVQKYENLSTVKIEIGKYISLLMEQKNLIYENEIRSIAKYIIFGKKIVAHVGESHYKSNMIFDILSTMHSLTGSSVRHFHYIYRSFIENFLRSILNLDDDDETGVNKLFRETKEKFKDNTTKHIFDYIKGEYSNSCMVVHSNQKSNTEIQLYYNEIIKNDDFNSWTLRTLINKVLLTLKNIITLLIYSNPQIVENAFYRKKQELEYLLHFTHYNIFEQEISFTH